MEANLSSFNLYDCEISFYIFTSGEVDGVEFAGLLTSRGGQYFKGGIEHYKGGNPILLRHTKKSIFYRHTSKSDGSIITRNRMTNVLGFKVVSLFTSKFKSMLEMLKTPCSRGFKICLLVADFGVVQMQEQHVSFRRENTHGWHCLF